METGASRIRTGIAGLGRSGWNIHSGTLKNLGGKYEVSAVCDKDPGRLEEARAAFGCRTYSCFEELIGDDSVELLVVATPSNLHSQNSIDALRAGKNVVCEKPMASNLSEADEMIKTARETGKMLTIFQNRRYAPDFLKVMEVVSSGKLGRILLVKILSHGFSRRWDWQTLKKLGGGTLRNTGPHPIDQALQFFEGREPGVFCQIDRALSLGDADDHLKIVFSLDGYPTVDVEVTSACAYPQENWLVMGTRGGLAGSSGKLRWKYFLPEDLPARKVETAPTPDRSYNREQIPWQPEEEWDIKDSPGNGREEFYLRLYKSLVEGAPPDIKPEEVRTQIAVIEKCSELFRD